MVVVVVVVVRDILPSCNGVFLWWWNDCGLEEFVVVVMMIPVSVVNSEIVKKD